jgi:hypothetical protein
MNTQMSPLALFIASLVVLASPTYSRWHKGPMIRAHVKQACHSGWHHGGGSPMRPSHGVNGHTILIMIMHPFCPTGLRPPGSDLARHG